MIKKIRLSVTMFNYTNSAPLNLRMILFYTTDPYLGQSITAAAATAYIESQILDMVNIGNGIWAPPTFTNTPVKFYLDYTFPGNTLGATTGTKSLNFTKTMKINQLIEYTRGTNLTQKGSLYFYCVSDSPALGTNIQIGGTTRVFYTDA